MKNTKVNFPTETAMRNIFHFNRWHGQIAPTIISCKQCDIKSGEKYKYFNYYDFLLQNLFDFDNRFSSSQRGAAIAPAV
jgi:hypothetical protein